MKKNIFRLLADEIVWVVKEEIAVNKKRGEGGRYNLKKNIVLIALS